MRRLGLLALVLVLPAAFAAAPASGGSGAWVRVQFDDRITDADRDALVAAGGIDLQYVPDDAYVAYAGAAAAEEAAAIDGVTDVRPVAPAEKVHPAVRNATGPLAVSVVAHPSAGVPGLNAVSGVRATARLVADAARIDSYAGDPAVLAISLAPTGLVPEDEGTAQVLAGNVAPGETPSPGYADFLGELGLDGTGVTVSIVDTGIDPNHPEFDGRIAEKFEYSPLPTGEPGDAYGHGTHVAGIVAGAAADIGPLGAAEDGDELKYGLGVAPGTTLVDQNAIALSTIPEPWPPEEGFTPIAEDAVSAGAVAWNASWTSGEGTGVGYVESARELDAITRDAAPGTDGNQPFTLVFSAGNSGPDEQTLTAPKEAKNIISVGASNSHRAGFTEAMAGFSSRGPALDGRVLPVVAAPGAAVASARSTTSTAACSVPEADAYGMYALCSGTSMAAPHVTGAVALIHEWWRRDNDDAGPSPAMVKALLVNTARDMLARDIPNVSEGWGRVDLGALFDPDAERVYLDESEILDALGAAHQLDVTPVDPTKPLRVTLVWTDAPAAANADPALVNDLDLTVTNADGTTWLGNNFDRGRSTTAGDPDRLNNVENVYLDEAGTGTYRIDVEAANLPGDGIPGVGDETDQDFALVVSNATLVR